ncbi:disease resistance protein RGA2-like [Vigna unguiculata]|uniref:disease resistance protein RGA2-like n=1 Tax=Vigna unguiculata TaxID=3917 RepID=UPI001016A1D2|nr:disease resistance protein RGA2-like [Vigna unguiculata]
MSIRTNKMKAVAVLMKQLTTARRKFDESGRDESFDGELEKLRSVLNKIKDVFMEVKKKEEKLLDTLAEVYDHLRRLNRRKLHEDMHSICESIRDSALMLLPTLVFDDSSKDEDHKGGKISHSLEELVQPHHQNNWTVEDYYLLHDRFKRCLWSLLIFPVNAVIRKRNAINLWIGEGLIGNTYNKTAEKEGEDVIDDLLKCNMIVRCDNGKGPFVNRFRILPGDPRGVLNLIRDLENIKSSPSPLQLDIKNVTVGRFDAKDHTLRNIFNIGASYLNFRPQWATELRNLEVLQLGRWQDSALHHIEVGSQEFLKDLRYLEELKYLSLRGISRIFELPSSIAELEKLLILDVKACHNLERLPDDISSMKSLTHLIMSECWLLEGMPKGIENLSNLEVLKGFLISTPEKTPCRISDLVNLRKLRRLSIRIGSEAEIRDGEFENLKYFSALEHLKISWSVSDPKYGYIRVILPPSLIKLHLECFPGNSFVDCFMPGSYDSGLSELNITGGKLESMNPSMLLWKVKILRLKYLKQLHVNMDDLKACFPGLKYVQIKQTSNVSYIERELNF